MGRNSAAHTSARDGVGLGAQLFRTNLSTLRSVVNPA